MSKSVRNTREKCRYFSDNLFSLMATLTSEIEELPEEMQLRLHCVAEQLLEEVYSQAKFERCEPSITKVQ